MAWVISSSRRAATASMPWRLRMVAWPKSPFFEGPDPDWHTHSFSGRCGGRDVEVRPRYGWVDTLVPPRPPRRFDRGSATSSQGT